MARVKAVLRRTYKLDHHLAGNPNTLTLDHEKQAAYANGVPLDLTGREYQLLRVLHNRPGRIYSRSQLLDLAFPDDSFVIDRTVDSHIKNIRHKIKVLVDDWDPIRSVYGVGYAFDD